MDWAGLGVLAGVFLGGLGYLARQLDHRFGELGAEMAGLRTEMRNGSAELRAEIRTLSDAYVRHLEHHAAR